MPLIFNKIRNKTIFTRDFSPLTKNNVIDFEKRNKIAVIYGPNGTGKTSLIKVLADADDTNIEFSFDDKKCTSGKDIFHVINDQNNRNIISGNAKEFLLGDNIRHEFELQEIIQKERQDLIANIISILKNKFSISTMNNPLNKIIGNPKIAEFIKDCVNTRSKGAGFDEEKLVALLSSIKYIDIPEYDENKLLFWQKDYSDKKSIIQQIQLLAISGVIPIPSISKIEENTIAIDVLNRFHGDTCVVCDHNIENWEKLLQTKQDSYNCTIAALDDKLKEMVKVIINLVPSDDPFSIKNILLDFLSTGRKEEFIRLNVELDNYKEVYNYLINNELLSIYQHSQISSHYAEYKELIAKKPEITDEDYLYIEEIISNSMNKKLKVDRDSNKQLKIILQEQEFLDHPRDELPLSNGEQNFLSLSFEFLKAKNSSQPIVVIDDPISSFDSIYKNKVVYAIVRMLQSKKRIILTHNIDFIRLLDSQYGNNFNLYILNNTDGENNGFIQLKPKEQGMLISLQKLLNAFRGDILPHIKNKELFLISMIPFMRGYANIIDNRAIFEELTKVMHGYKTEEVDIAEIYHKLFTDNSQYLPTSYRTSVNDILDKTIDGKTIIDNQEYPLLDRTLRHSFTYLFLRLMIEKKLVEKFNIDVSQNEQLGQIIAKAYPDENNIDQIRNRIRLTSKKTPINEFNHFEGNLSIFQPAIDITDQALGKERTDITTFINNL